MHLLWGTWLRTLHWWRKVGRDKRRKKPSTRQDSNPWTQEFCYKVVCSTAVLQPQSKCQKVTITFGAEYLMLGLNNEMILNVAGNARPSRRSRPTAGWTRPTTCWRRESELTSPPTEFRSAEILNDSRACIFTVAENNPLSIRLARWCLKR